MATSSSSRIAAGVSRRTLLGLMAIAAMPMSNLAFADTGPVDTMPTEAITTIQRFDSALLGAMKSGEKFNFNHRFQALAPSVDRTFDLRAVLAISVGPAWAGFAPAQQDRLLDAFRRYTIASYVANFDNYAGQTFTVSPATRSLGADRVIVNSRIVPTSGDATELDYVMRQTSEGWKVVDVLAAGSISRVAVQRSDFRRLLSSGGHDALVASLRRKTTDLSGGALA